MRDANIDPSTVCDKTYDKIFSIDRFISFDNSFDYFYFSIKTIYLCLIVNELGVILMKNFYELTLEVCDYVLLLFVYSSRRIHLQH